MSKSYEIKDIKKPKKCKGCGQWIEKGSNCIYKTLSWRGVAYKAYYHDEECIEHE